MSNWAWPVALVLLGMFFSGCQEGPAASGTKTEWFRICESSAQCPDGSDCLCGVCTAECASDTDCVVGLCKVGEGSADSCVEEEHQNICVASSELLFSAATSINLNLPGTSGVDDPSFTEDRLELYFAVKDYPQIGDLSRIWKSTRASTTAPWGEPTPVNELTDENASESMPGVSSDGLTIYFARNSGSAEGQLYASARSSRDADWAPPEPVPFNNDTGLGDSPSGTSDGLLLSWSRLSSETTRSEIFLAQRTTLEAPWESLGVITGISEGETTKFEPWLSDDGLTLFYRRGKDLYSSWRANRDTSFGTGIPVKELNTISLDGDPWLSQDTRFIMFASDRDGSWLIYEASR